jgi:hypothetical protein
LNDMRIVANDGDGKSAMYRCIAITGTIAQQWEKLADLDYTNNHSALINLTNDDHLQYLRTDGARSLTGNIDFGKNQAINFVPQRGTVEPENPVLGQLWYDTEDNKLMEYKGALGWTDISGKGCVIRYKEYEITSNTPAGVRVFDLQPEGTYELGMHMLDVYIIRSSHVLWVNPWINELTTTTFSLQQDLLANDIIVVKWFENRPEVVNLVVQKNGELQSNLNADLLDGKHASEFATTTVLADTVGALESFKQLIRQML